MNLFNDFALRTAPDQLVRITVILAAAWLLAGGLRRQAAARHAILLSGVVAAFLLPLAMLAASALSVPRWNIEVAPAVTPVSTAQADEICLITTQSQENYIVQTSGATTAGRSTTVEPVEPACPKASSGSISTGTPAAPTASFDWHRVAQIVAALWAIVAVFRCGGLALSLVRLRNIVRRASAVEPQPAQPLLARIQRRVGLRNPPELRESADVAGPIAAGIVGNYILVPAGWISRLTRIELYSVICHEAAHLARRDHRVVILQEILTSVLWFHPLAHLVSRALVRAREEVCDNYAIRSLDRPSYCAALFRLAGGGNHEPLLAATSLSSRHWPLEERIRGILDDKRPTVTGVSRATRFAIGALAVVLGGLTTLPAITAAEPEHESHESSASASANATTGDVEVRHASEVRPLEKEVHSILITSRVGSLTIDQANDDKLHIEATVRIDTQKTDPASIGDKLEDLVELTLENGALLIQPRVKGGRPNQALPVDLALSVPAGLAIEAQTSDGDIAVKDLEAKLALTTHDGDIAIKSHSSSSLAATTHDGDIAVDTQTTSDKIALTAHDGDVTLRAGVIRGELSAQSFDGDVTIAAGSVAAPLSAESHEGDVTVKLTDKEPGAGPISLSSSQGSIVLEAQAASKVAANTAQGSIVLRLTGSGVQDGLAASTSDGDVTLEVARETNADLALVTRDGEIAIAGQPTSGNIISTRLGQGGPKYAVATDRGSITIKQIEE